MNRPSNLNSYTVIYKILQLISTHLSGYSLNFWQEIIILLLRIISFLWIHTMESPSEADLKKTVRRSQKKAKYYYVQLYSYCEDNKMWSFFGWIKRYCLCKYWYIDILIDVGSHMDGKSYLLLVDEIFNFSKKKSFSRDGLLLLINAFYNATASPYRPESLDVELKEISMNTVTLENVLYWKKLLIYR